MRTKAGGLTIHGAAAYIREVSGCCGQVFTESRKIHGSAFPTSQDCICIMPKDHEGPHGQTMYPTPEGDVTAHPIQPKDGGDE